MIADAAHQIATFLISEAVAGENGSADVVKLAPGFTWNFSFGQILQVVGLLVPIVLMWNRSQIKHALLLRDLGEMRRDVNAQQNDLNTVKAQVTQIDQYLRQLPALIAATDRGRRPFVPFAMRMYEGHAEPSLDPFKDALREELGGGEENNETVEKVIDAFKKLAGLKE